MIERLQPEESLTLFLNSYSKDTEILSQLEPATFVDELHRRWMQQHGGNAPEAREAQPESPSRGAMFFVSYTRISDQARAESVVQALLHLGVSAREVWFDRSTIAPSHDFEQRILLGIQGCRYLRGAGDVQRTQQVFDDLGDLIENRIPAPLVEEAASAKRASLDLLSQRYRVVLSFREDFLPELKNWERKVPSLSRHFLRLEAMSGPNAVEAVERAGAAVIESGVGQHIVDFVGRQDATADDSPAELMTIEPVLLSLCCSELNRRRPPDGKIDRALIDEAGQDILESFYRDALADDEVKGLPDVADFIENHLIQGDRFRGTYPVADAIEKGLLLTKRARNWSGNMPAPTCCEANATISRSPPSLRWSFFWQPS